MNLFNHYRHHIITALNALVEQGMLPAALNCGPVTVEPPRDPAHGDLATNAAMVLAKAAGQTPRALAEHLLPLLQGLPGVTSVQIANPGFINLRLDHDVWTAQIADVLHDGSDYGRATVGTGKRVNVEFVSANPTGPMHMGHCRGAVVGDVLANILAFAGFAVTREYYVNDAGGQVDTLARSAYLRYREALGEAIGAIPEGLYPGEYLSPVGAALAQEFGTQYQAAPEADWLHLFKRRAVAAMLALIKADLATLGVRHDLFASEQEVQDIGAVQATIDELTSRNLVYTGTLDKPKGEDDPDWEPRELLLFRSTQFGDDQDRPLKKSDGSWTYFGADIAYHRQKARSADALVNIWGADHSGTVKRIKAAVAAITNGIVPLDILLVQMVRLFRNGEPVKMSKRSGNFVTLAEVVEEVGAGVVRFMMLTRKSDSQLDFDFVKVQEQSRDNPVFYVQYAHARATSALTKAQDINPNLPALLALVPPASLRRLNRAEEVLLIRKIAEWPRVVEASAETREPHRIAFYLQDLAAALHGHWNLGNDDPSLRFLMPEDVELTSARALLVAAVRQVLRNGLALMGVEPVAAM